MKNNLNELNQSCSEMSTQELSELFTYSLGRFIYLNHHKDKHFDEYSKCRLIVFAISNELNTRSMH